MRRGLHMYVTWLTRKNFHAINFNTIEVDNDRSVLLIANHFSWWDSLVLYWVSRHLFKKKFHVMLLERTSKREPFVKYGGAFSINKKTRDIIESLNFAAKLLHDPENLVLIFPQGKIYSNFINETNFEKGIVRIMQNAPDKFQIITAAIFIENFDHKKPTANVYLNSIDKHYNFTRINELQQAYQQHYNAARLLQNQITKE